jgi:hypothetical protein
MAKPGTIAHPKRAASAQEPIAFISDLNARKKAANLRRKRQSARLTTPVIPNAS